MSKLNDEYTVEPGQTWEVDLFRPEDAEGVARCFRAVYGDAYPIKTYYNPNQLIDASSSGEIYLVVSRTARGDIISLEAMYRSAPFQKIYEIGMGIVLNEYRQLGLNTRMIAHIIEVVAPKFNMPLVYGESVCNHVYMQKASIGLGFISAALEVNLMPAEAYDKEKSAEGRVSALLDFLSFHSDPHTVYLPQVYEDALLAIYSELGYERSHVPSRTELPGGLHSEARTRVFDFAQVARVAVHQVGADFRDFCDELESRLLAKGAQVVQVWFKLTCPWVGKAVDILRSKGYFLGGILPRWFDTDGLLMQKIVGRPNWDGIKIHSDWANKILELVKADWERSGKGP